jgi:hypothetical protein
MARPKYTPMQRQIRRDQDRDQERIEWAERMKKLRADPAAYKEWKAKKAAYMRQYRAKRDAANAALRSQQVDGGSVQQVQPPADEPGVLSEVRVPGVPGPG